MSSSEWLPEDKFLRQEGSKQSGLPKKHIHIDSTSQLPTSQRKTGMLYAAESHTEAVNAHPRLLCPSCGELASGIGGGKQLYQVDIAESAGKSHRGDVPPCPIEGMSTPIMCYNVEPCGCRVNQEWAGAFNAELNRRLSGQKPCDVVDMTPKQRAAKITTLENRLSLLYSIQANTAMNTQGREAADYWIVIVADQLQRLCPGVHNTKPTVIPLGAKVANWASINNFTQPDVVPAKTPPCWPMPSGVSFEAGLDKAASDAEVVFGTLVYRKADGTLSPNPAYQGQLAFGTVMGKSSELGSVLADTGKAKIQNAVDAMKLAVQMHDSGIISKQSLQEQFATHMPATLDHDEKPKILKTKNGQYGVSHGDVYKVFVTIEEAQAFAAQLVNVFGGWVKDKMPGKPKPTLQTLPVSEQVNVFGSNEEAAPYLAKVKAEYMVKIKKILEPSETFDLPPQPVSLPAPETLKTELPKDAGVAPPTTERHTKKKRTIRKIED